MLNDKYKIAAENGKINIPKLIEANTDLCEWERWRKEIRSKLLDIFGGLPESVDTDVKINSTVEEDGYRRMHLTYASNVGDRVTAYLLKPADIKEGEKRPAIMALHPTAPEGKDVSAGLCGKPGRQYGQELVKRGYVVLVPDIFAAGERIPKGEKDYETGFFYEKYPEWSAIGKMLYDHIQGLDYLVSLPEVDAERIGTIGHSLGGHNAFFLAAFDERIKAAVSSCGLCSINGDPNVFRWSRDSWFVYVKALREQFETGFSPFEFHEVLALIAPRAYFNYSGKLDDCFPHWEGVNAIQERVEDVYRLYSAGSKLEFMLGEGGHDFPDEARNRAYQFLDRNLRQGK